MEDSLGGDAAALPAAFGLSVDQLNKDKAILPNTRLDHDIQYISKESPFEASAKTCLEMSLGYVSC